MKQFAPEYTIEKIEDAYRRFKHFIYYDNNFLHYRMKIAEFECSKLEEDENNGIENKDLPINSRLKNLCEKLNESNIDINSWLENISAFPVPKAVSSNKEPNNNDCNEKGKKKCAESTIIHNAQSDKIIVKKATWLIDVPIEIHIISVLWTLQYGIELQPLYKKSNFANLLHEDIIAKEKSLGLNLFSPYFINYQKWRDKAIKKAKSLISDGEDVLMIGLDVKEYYHSISVKKSDYNPIIKDGFDLRLGKILFEVSKHYFQNVVPTFQRAKNTFGLPIGLISSCILANWYLTDFDNEVHQKFQPTYYGRYVDDILIVVRCPKKCKSSEEISKIADTYLNQILSEKDEICQRKILVKKNLSIQNSKVTIYYFDADEPVTLLEKFIQEIRNNSSEFRFLPTEGEAKMEFQEAAFSINYDGSKMKLRSIKDFTPNRFGVSTYLAKLIFASIRVNEKIDKETANQVLTFFKGIRAIDFYQLWEKAFTYFVVTKNSFALIRLEKNIEAAIENIETINDLEESRIKAVLKTHLRLSKSMALSLNPKNESLESDIIKLRESNMIRHSYVCSPLVNYLKISQTEDWSYIDFDNQKSDSKIEKKLIDVIRGNSWKFSPRFVHFHEISLLWLDRHLLKVNHSEMPAIIPKDYLNQIFSIFYHLNYLRTKPNVSNSDIDETQQNVQSSYFSISDLTESNSNLQVQNINVHSDKIVQNVRIALANLEVSESDVKASYLDKPNLTVERRDNLYSILNQITNQGGADVLILPEASVPYRWMTLICDQVRVKNMATGFGLEHWIKDGFAYNILVTLLPVRINTRIKKDEDATQFFDAVIPVFRVKNHYSPDEIEELEGYHHNIPQPKPHFYHLFNWRGLKFTTFNCFELADISHRSFFRSKIDFLIACEYNSDVNYFSNIAESASRDLHCFFIQANSANFGDSRITQPVKTDIKDIIRIKGGINPTALIGYINVKGLREFQYKEWNLQLRDKSFKPTPPGFEKDDVEKRLGLSVLKKMKNK